jgi:long-chain acyl-CoA synthetase
VIHTGFWTAAQAQPAHIAVVDDSGEELSFGELFANQNRVANGLRALGLGVGDCVAGLLWNQREFLELALAAAQIGLYLLPINWHLTAPEVAHILADSGAAALVADERMGAVAVRAADEAK